MAITATLSANLTVIENGITTSVTLPAVTWTPVGVQYIGNPQVIGTVAETLDLGDCASAGALILRNLDLDNYVEVDSVNSFDKFPQKILPGRAILLAPETTTIYAKAHTASCRVSVGAVEL